MSTPKGGRGKKAPYESTHVRVPLPLKDKLEALIEEYRASLLEDENSLTGYRNKPLTSYDNKPLTSLEDAKEEARRLIKAKKSASQSLSKLLSTIYHVKVTAEELR